MIEEFFKGLHILYSDKIFNAEEIRALSVAFWKKHLELDLVLQKPKEPEFIAKEVPAKEEPKK